MSFHSYYCGHLPNPFPIHNHKIIKCICGKTTKLAFWWKSHARIGKSKLHTFTHREEGTSNAPKDQTAITTLRYE